MAHVGTAYTRQNADGHLRRHGWKPADYWGIDPKVRREYVRKGLQRQFGTYGNLGRHPSRATLKRYDKLRKDTWALSARGFALVTGNWVRPDLPAPWTKFVGYAHHESFAGQCPIVRQALDLIAFERVVVACALWGTEDRPKWGHRRASIYDGRICLVDSSVDVTCPDCRLDSRS